MNTPRPPTRPRGDRLAHLLAVVVALWTLLVHQGFSPLTPEGDATWALPSAFLIPLLASESLSPLGAPTTTGLLLFAGPALGLAIAIFASTRRIPARLAGVVGTLMCGVIVFYGVQAPRVWGFFGWRWSLVILVFALLTGATLIAPWLTERWRHLGASGRALLYLPVFLAVVALTRDVTGTDPALPFSISPWPVIQVTALQIAVPVLSAAMLGVAVGLLPLARSSPPLAHVGGALLACLPLPVFLVAGAGAGWLPIRPDPPWLVAAGALGIVLFAAAAGVAPRDRPGLRARVWAGAALLCALPVALGSGLAWLDYRSSREDRAQQLITALDAHYADQGYYPDSLDELVDAGRIPRVPPARAAVPGILERSFRFQNFGSSYVLEFDAPRWVQCAYNPPFVLDDDEEDEIASGGIEEDALAAAWSCPSTPPELW